MTSAPPLSVVLSLLSQMKEGKRGRSVAHEMSSLDNVIIKIQTEITLNDRIDTLTNDAMQANADSNVMQMEKEKSEKNLNHRSLLKIVMMTS